MTMRLRIVSVLVGVFVLWLERSPINLYHIRRP